MYYYGTKTLTFKMTNVCMYVRAHTCLLINLTFKNIANHRIWVAEEILGDVKIPNKTERYIKDDNW